MLDLGLFFIGGFVWQDWFGQRQNGQRGADCGQFQCLHNTFHSNESKKCMLESFRAIKSSTLKKARMYFAKIVWSYF